MKRNSIFIGAVFLVLAACEAPQGGSTASLPAQNDGGKISVLFQDFRAGMRCTVKTPEGLLVADTMPGKIDYSGKYRDANVACSHPDGALYAIDVDGSLPGSFRVAGITVRPNGTLVATVSTGSELLNISTPDAVRKIN